MRRTIRFIRVGPTRGDLTRGDLTRKGARARDPLRPAALALFPVHLSVIGTGIVPVGRPGPWKQALRWLRDPLGPRTVRWVDLPRAWPWLLQFLRHGSREEVVRIAGALRTLLAPIFECDGPLVQRAGAEHCLLALEPDLTSRCTVRTSRCATP